MNSRRTTAAALLLAAIMLVSTACGDSGGKKQADTAAGTSASPASSNTGSTGTSADASKSKPSEIPAAASTNGQDQAAGAPGGVKQTAQTDTKSGKKTGDVQVVASPADIAVLVNKTFKLPDNYKPQDLVDPNVSFTFKEKLEKRKMRKEAAAALEKLFEAAKKDNLPLAGVSAYRSHETQKTVYNRYVQKDGEAAANKYSAKPGHSEHETGLAIDVAGSSGKCAAQDCFGATKEAKWLAEHAADYGFIIRYPEGKENITGYQYEPWHLRYVGVDTAKTIAKQGVTLEEYVKNAVPVTKPKS
ncbi:D-alanyl-D-alanine carboxypeptidase family protein [Paenibacillus sp. MZ04-78.2]|uniref:M15 family metallopeptidase n=1 Tax=Paenibacillus sp. MZ04-78.2 TaxID=2962034 RepID=UPI0020B7F7E2|nr:M15 family metallopeptidase [Paenibacillus sp. MZ04-78.2]MCP3775114.1 D-alanyl-D-alanine carboxypeptidase family protein [Paenibacillus sp. MZ04-78.2]